MTRPGTAWRVVALLATWLFTAPLHAQGAAGDGDAGDAEVQRAREHFEVALTLYRTGRFHEAAEEFTRAFELSGAPELLHNMYLAYRDAGRLPEAADALGRFLATSEDLPSEQRSILQHRLAALESSLATSPEEREPVATAEETEARETDARAAEAEDGDPAEPPAADLEPSEPPRGAETPASDPPWGAIAAYAVGGLGFVMTAVSGPLALEEQDALRQRCAPSCSPDEMSGVRTLAVLADVGLGVGALGVAVGTVLLVVGLATGGDDAPVAVAPFAGPDRAGVVIEGRL